ncbi:acyltransferase [Actinoplanes sp. NPDC051633]|uniref:acyltransferase family protein n=1 Tax=Actinoplanes sp. NPDC051633 TaxID=3155670 RepID=UPI00342F5A03
MNRDRYFDSLRVLAIIRVVLFHAFPFAALELVFPSMGVMFALGGSLMVKSLDKSVSRTIRNRIRRLLPALWVMGLILVPLMLRLGWPDHARWSLLLWLFPVANPPASEFGYPAAGVLWYLVTYLWLVLLSPLLLKLYRRARLATILLPLALLGVFVIHPDVFGAQAGEVVQNVLMFAACWVLGFAHREGDLRRVRAAVLLPLAVAAVGGTLLWAFEHPADTGFDLVGIPLAYAIYSVGFVLVLLRWSPPMGWLARARPVDRFVSMVNNRAVTIYLWHNVAITIAVVLFDPLKLWEIPTQVLEDVVDFALAMSLLVVAVLSLGWVEDIAARRKPRMSPFPRPRRTAPAAVVPQPAAPEPATVQPVPA